MGHSLAISMELRGHIDRLIFAPDGARCCQFSHQPDRGTRHAHADADLRANRDKFEESPERFGNEGIVLVVTVVAHTRAKQAARDPDADAGAP
jgi:hypothetical protein